MLYSKEPERSNHEQIPFNYTVISSEASGINDAGKKYKRDEIYDFVKRRKLNTYVLFGERNKYGDDVASVISEIVGDESAFSLGIKSDSPDQLAPISITYNNVDNINFNASYTPDGDLSQIQVEPFLETDDLAELWWDNKNFTRLYIDQADSQSWWARGLDSVTREPYTISSGALPILEEVPDEETYLGSIGSNSATDSIPISIRKIRNSLEVKLARTDGLNKHIEVPIKLQVPNFNLLRRGDLKSILDFPLKDFFGFTTGQRIPPSLSGIDVYVD